MHPAHLGGHMEPPVLRFAFTPIGPINKHAPRSKRVPLLKTDD